MTTSKRLPPSGRDFQVYRLVTVEQKSTREVATECGLSQTRVCQIVARVGAFQAEVLPADGKATREQQVRMGEMIAAEQVQFLMRLAVRSFERSQGPQRIERSAAGEQLPKKTVVVTRQSYGDTRYLALAGRLALLGAKLPASNLGAYLAADDAEQVEAAEAGETQTEAPPAASPQKEECSPTPAEQPPPAVSEEPADTVTPTAPEGCESTAAEVWTELRAALPTVQIAISPGEDEQASCPERQPLSKQERRARRKQLAEKLQTRRRAG